VTPAEVVRAFWGRIAAHDWPGARALLADDVVLDYPHTAERFVGADTVIRLNADYPDGWSIEVVDVVADGDRVVAEVEVPMVGVGIFAVASFATVAGGRIVRAREYWIKEAGAEPESARDHLAQRYDGRVSS
jgi:ketosteroid isomerase-like protein